MKELQQRRSSRDNKRKAEILVGDKVRIKTSRFGKAYAKGKPKYTDGKVIAIRGKKGRRGV